MSALPPRNDTLSSYIKRGAPSHRRLSPAACGSVQAKRTAGAPAVLQGGDNMASDFRWDEVHLSEDPADALLREIGYEFVATEVLDGERESLAEPVLIKRLDAALRRLNPWINDDNARKAVRSITHATA